MSDKFKGVVELDEQQYAELEASGELNYDDGVLLFDENRIYVTPLDSESSALIEVKGTEDSPINFASDMDTGKLYSCSGNIYSSSLIENVSVTFVDTGRFLIYKHKYNTVLVLNCSVKFNNDTYTIEPSNNGNCAITFNNDGEITNIEISTSAKSINGGITSPNIVYVATESGNSGQILQSSGENTAPGWTNIENFLKIVSVNPSELKDKLQEIGVDRVFDIEVYTNSNSATLSGYYLTQKNTSETFASSRDLTITMNEYWPLRFCITSKGVNQFGFIGHGSTGNIQTSAAFNNTLYLDVNSTSVYLSGTFISTGAFDTNGTVVGVTIWASDRLQLDNDNFNIKIRYLG